ncbi:LRR repeats and ubiquitin-like domain-containing protein At2g30105 isoform X3 [Durio zibethinus]|uniref:LRR repeats and ubiquitin-like domain-containing protein At2g30105 isoform X3 n=1 Tax=Durio zibethinus TaxID=66656 RepID=A0A6P5XV72_DURZI|nr:LRR repeats and ubiquitin-like domain-containing protein At2g30105 isoform X3 [Durio zibethinus]
MSKGEGESSENINIIVKFSGRSIPVSVAKDSTIKDLKSHLQPLTNVLPRGQKLIFKGKLLVDAMTLKESEVMNGAKLMLIASQGLHQGGGPILKEAQTRPISRTVIDYKKSDARTEITMDKNRLERWKATGVIALADCNLKNKLFLLFGFCKAIPDEVWDCGSSARVLDVNNNSIQDVPSKISSLNSIQKLFLNANGISDEAIHWEGLTSMKYLTVLSINQNHLTALPSALGFLTSLRQLHVANNKLTTLPNEIGILAQLEVLKANNNRITTIPACIGECNSLSEVDLSANLLSELPETVGNLHNLKECLQLATLDLHNTEITMDVLRQFEGWEDFDKRRRSKHQKQLDFRVVSSAAFDEGADKN